MSLKQGEIVAEKIIPPALDLELTIRGDVVLVRLVRIYKMALINWRENTAVQIDLVDPEVSPLPEFTFMHAFSKSTKTMSGS